MIREIGIADALNNLIAQLKKHDDAVEVMATNITAEAYKPINKALKGEPTRLKDLVTSVLIIAGAMRFRFIDFNEVAKIIKANELK